MVGPSTYIGMMSGTSADGVDAALVQFNGVDSFEVLGTHFVAYDTDTQARVNELGRTNSELNTESIRDLDTSLAAIYAAAVEQLLNKHPQYKLSIVGIANHGQTVRHEPNASPPRSVQLGGPQLVANQTGYRVISNFRQADIDFGGQGAPLMPAFHAAILPSTSAAVVNLGGIANITFIGNGPVIGFDSGPGNTLMDQWMMHHKGTAFDANGHWAASGTVDQALLSALMQDPYFIKTPPKSTGPDYFNLDWLNSIAHAHLSRVNDAASIQATLCELTAQSVCSELEKRLPTNSKVFICGGGAHNSYLLQRMMHIADQYRFELTDSIGVPADWVEAVGFAWLGYCFDHNIPSNLPSVTGARQSCVLGELFLPKRGLESN